MKYIKDLVLLIFRITACSFFGCAVVFAMLETGIRAGKFYEYPPGLYRVSKTRAFKHAKNFKGIDGYGCKVSTNASGFRDLDYVIPKPNDVYRIVVLGDSVTFGVGINLKDTYPKQLQQLLNQDSKTDFEVINTGVRGYNTYQQVQLLKEDALIYDPDMIIVGFVLNDAEPFSAQSGMIDPKHQTLIKIKNFFKQHTYSYAFLRKRLELLRHKCDVKAYQEQYLDQFKPGHKGWEECYQAIEELAKICAKYNIKLVTVIIPRVEYFKQKPPYMDVYERVYNAWQKNNATVYNAYEAFEGKDPAEMKVFPSDTFHYNKEGNKILAEYIYEKEFKVVANQRHPAA